MRAFTVHWLWAFAIMRLGKDTENRKGIWPAGFAGDAMVTASAYKFGSRAMYIADQIRKILGDDADSMTLLEAELRQRTTKPGHAVGVISIRSASPNGQSPSKKWAMADHLGIELAAPRLITPFQVRGALGLWHMVVCPFCGIAQQRPAANKLPMSSCAECSKKVGADGWREPQLAFIQ